MNTILSIIIPHKNNSELLPALFNTIPVSDLIEIIVIDDHSSSDHTSTLEQLQLHFNFNLILLQTTGFAGKARNIGIQAAKGDWLIFADADDRFTSEMHSIICPHFEDSVNDVIYFDVTSEDTSGSLSYRHETYSRLVQAFEQNKTTELDIRYKFTPPWGKMYRRKFIIDNNIWFDEIPASNDLYFSIQAGHLSENVTVDRSILYIITQRPGSLTSTISKTNLISRFNAALKVNKYLRQIHRPQYQHSILYFIYRALYFNPLLSIQMAIKSIKAGNNIFIGSSKLKTALKTIKRGESR